MLSCITVWDACFSKLTSWILDLNDGRPLQDSSTADPFMGHMLPERSVLFTKGIKISIDVFDINLQKKTIDWWKFWFHQWAKSNESGNLVDFVWVKKVARWIFGFVLFFWGFVLSNSVLASNWSCTLSIGLEFHLVNTTLQWLRMY